MKQSTKSYGRVSRQDGACYFQCKLSGIKYCDVNEVKFMGLKHLQNPVYKAKKF